MNCQKYNKRLTYINLNLNVVRRITSTMETKKENELKSIICLLTANNNVPLPRFNNSYKPITGDRP